MKITLAKLKKVGACREAVDWFEKEYGKKGAVEVTKEQLSIAISKGMRFSWFSWLMRKFPAMKKDFFSDPAFSEHSFAYYEIKNKKIGTEIKEKALKVVDKRITDGNRDRSLIGSFIWDDTPEGHKFWAEIDDTPFVDNVEF